MTTCVGVYQHKIYEKKFKENAGELRFSFSRQFSLQDPVDFSLVLDSIFSYFSLFPCNNQIMKLSVTKKHYFERVT